MLTTLLAFVTLAAPTVNVRVDGEGYLRFTQEGRVVYARLATLTEKGGKLAHAEGPLVTPQISVSGGGPIRIDLDGTVRQGTKRLGRLVLAGFAKDAVLTPRGSFLASGVRPKLGNPGEDTFGVLRTGAPSEPPKAAPPVQESAAPIGVKVASLTEIETETLQLGQIAAIEGDGEAAQRLRELDLGEAPPIGLDKPIHRFLLLARLREAGFEPARIALEIPEGARVKRRGQVISGEHLVAFAAEAAGRELGIVGDLKADREQKDLEVAGGDLELVVERCYRSGTRIQVVVAIHVTGRRVASRTIGLIADRQAGVKAGESVRLFLISGGATLEVPGVARTAGWVGQTVRVESNTGSVHQGVVTAPGAVEVRL